MVSLFVALILIYAAGLLVTFRNVDGKLTTDFKWPVSLFKFLKAKVFKVSKDNETHFID